MAEKAGSEDDFQDALSEPVSPIHKVTTKSTEQDKLIDEIIEKNTNLRLEDDNDDEKEKATGAPGGNDGADDDNQKEALQPDGELSMEELLLREKDMSTEQLAANKEQADKLKLEGNELFKNDEPARAVEIYTEALNICPSSNSKERAVLFGNRAAAKMKLEANKSAIDDCTKAIDLYPEYVRALLRRAKLYEQDDRPDEALADYKRVNEIDPGQREAREAQARLPAVINARNEKLKADMLNGLKGLGDMILKPFGLSTANFQMQQDPNSGSYSINFNQNNS
ncbi:tetratricopeptide repeat protein 1 [Drosophila grimshawi]|uniref:Tetratricopeptide repeat protein 1 n=1 Tax=Drosophila grimshawi TaxID=7222 RepID=B4JFL4_DROGR|nr:tetratricopeptide repeat protein 1 [Drosophila grimshawi]EDV93495.1 GH18243 [Drosophila grimshawi]